MWREKWEEGMVEWSWLHDRGFAREELEEDKRRGGYCRTTAKA